MNSLAMSKAIVVIMLLLSAVGMPTEAQNTVVVCNVDKYRIGTPFALNVDKVLLYLQRKTPISECRDFSFHLINPDVYGHANCSVSITRAECTSCIGSAIADTSASCGTAVGAMTTLDDCTIRYEAYKF